MILKAVNEIVMEIKGLKLHLAVRYFSQGFKLTVQDSLSFNR